MAGIFAVMVEAKEDDSPGTTRGVNPFCLNHVYSSPPRPKMYGSPCFNRTTLLPRCSASSPSCRNCCCASCALPGNFLAMMSVVVDGIKFIIGCGTNLSDRIKSAVLISCNAPSVSMDRDPGPLPTREMFPVRVVDAGRDKEQSDDCRSFNVIESSWDKG